VELLRQLIIREGLLLIYHGICLHPRLLRERLLAMLGEDVGAEVKHSSIYAGGPGVVVKDVEEADLMESGLEDILELNAYGVQIVLEKVDRAYLLIVLSRAAKDIRRTVLTNLSRNAADMICEDLVRFGTFSNADIEVARKMVASTVVELEEEGSIVIEGECKARQYAV
jgi:hypothetical protein